MAVGWAFVHIYLHTNMHMYISMCPCDQYLYLCKYFGRHNNYQHEKIKGVWQFLMNYKLQTGDLKRKGENHCLFWGFLFPEQKIIKTVQIIVIIMCNSNNNKGCCYFTLPTCVPNGTLWWLFILNIEYFDVIYSDIMTSSEQNDNFFNMTMAMPLYMICLHIIFP